MFSDSLARDTIRGFLYRLRRAVRTRGLDRERLPWWLSRTQVRIGWVGESLVAVFDGAPAEARSDRYTIRGAVGADMVLLLDVEDYQPSGASVAARETEGFIVMVGEVDGQSRLRVESERPAFFDCGYAGYHGPRALMNLFMEHSIPAPNADQAGMTVAARFVPFALYVHEDDTRDPDRVWRLAEPHLLAGLARIVESPAGDFYARGRDRPQTFSVFNVAEQAVAVTKEKGVIVLGAYDAPYRAELLSVREALSARGYDAKLISELAEIPMMSNEEKVRLWTAASRFCVMVDRAPSGHVLEYGILRDGRVIGAFLQPESGGSTFMIGDAHLVDVRHLRRFEFKDRAVTVVDPAVAWAEEMVRERERAYGAAYPWR
jgi:hypothetical protein